MTDDLKLIVGCIDPRDEVADKPKVIMQTAGGAFGEGHDMSLTLSVIQKKPIEVQYGVAEDATRRMQTDVLAAHSGCRFKEGYESVLEEESNPSSFTAESVENWARYHQKWDSVRQALPSVMEAAGVQLGYLRETGGIDRLEPVVDGLYPDHSNLRQMVGQNQAGIYIVNHFPHIGLNRYKIHREHRLKVQGYHDNLLATVNTLEDRRLTSRERRLRRAAAYLRAAATRSVLVPMHASTKCIEIFPSKLKGGMSVEEIPLPEAA